MNRWYDNTSRRRRNWIELSMSGQADAIILVNAMEEGDVDRREDLLPRHADDVSSSAALVDPQLTTNTENQQNRRFSYLYSGDFKEMIACLIFAILCSIIVLVPILPRQRPIPYQQLQDGEYVINLSLNEPFDGDTVSDSLAAFLAVVLPLLTQLGLAKYFVRLGAAHATICCYLVAFGLTVLTTFAVKNYVGYLRPAFYDLCVPTEDYSECTADEDNGELTRKSFPSGHASTSFCGFTLLTLFLHTSFGLPNYYLQQQQQQQQSTSSNSSSAPSGHLLPRVTWYRFISIFSLVPMALATFIAASRVVDNKHWPADVVAGALLGASISYFVHGLWFVW